MRPMPFLFAALVVLSGGLSTTAQAQAETQAAGPSEADTARARELFHEGVELANGGNYAEAATRFREALTLRPAQAISYNLAAALAQTGQLVEAGDLVDGVLGDVTTPDSVRVPALELRAALDGRYARLTIHLAGDPGDATIYLGDEAIDEGLFGTPLRLDPGIHAVSARRGDAVLEHVNRTIAEGETAEVSLDPTAWAILGAEVGGEGEAEDSASTPIYEKWWFWTAIGAVVVGVVIIGVVAASGGTEDPVQGNTLPAVITFP